MRTRPEDDAAVTLLRIYDAHNTPFIFSHTCQWNYDVSITIYEKTIACVPIENDRAKRDLLS